MALFFEKQGEYRDFGKTHEFDSTESAQSIALCQGRLIYGYKCQELTNAEKMTLYAPVKPNFLSQNWWLGTPGHHLPAW